MLTWIKHVSLFILLPFVLGLSGCTQKDKKGPVITDAVTAKETTGIYLDPAGITDTFVLSQSPIHLVVTIKDAPANTSISVNLEESSQKKVYESEYKTPDVKGSQNVDFTFKLPVGEYKAEIYLNEDFDRKINFSVVENSQSSTPSGTSKKLIIVTNAVMAKDVQPGDLGPTGITDTFPADQPLFHLIVTITDAPDNTVVKSVWLTSSNQKMAEAESKSSGSRNLDFTFTPNGGKLPAGDYKVEIYVNDVFDRTVTFTVQ